MASGLIKADDNRRRPWGKMMAYIVARVGGLAPAAELIGISVSTCSLVRAGKLMPGKYVQEKIDKAWSCLIRNRF